MVVIVLLVVLFSSEEGTGGRCFLERRICLVSRRKTSIVHRFDGGTERMSEEATFVLDGLLVVSVFPVDGVSIITMSAASYFLLSSERLFASERV